MRWICLTLSLLLLVPAQALPVKPEKLVGTWQAVVRSRTPGDKPVEITYTYHFEPDQTGWKSIHNSAFEVDSQQDISWTVEERELVLTGKTGVEERIPILGVNGGELLIRRDRRLSLKRIR